uniref:WGS project CAEQ00000000 data, annotated contig 1151 n=1 Tax=Trypanosoma congolense (strain IL3000) TaxID=1068625 RepID=F9W466_TRYCI|nr:unnamed protein product [Trypanosoma congolense IL3000]
MSHALSWFTSGKAAGAHCAVVGEKEAGERNELLNVTEDAQLSQGGRIVGEAAFIRSNRRHKVADAVLALVAYTFSGFIYMYGQGTALTTLSMWAAGTTFLLNMQVRKVFELEDEEKRLRVAADAGLQEKNVFQLEMVASWVWLLCSMQQFKIHKRLKYSGYSSWTALGCCSYFTLRHMCQKLLSE